MVVEEMTIDTKLLLHIFVIEKSKYSRTAYVSFQAKIKLLQNNCFTLNYI